MQTLNLEVPPTRPYGQRVGQLTRFGETWIALDLLVTVDFAPEDGCGCEYFVRGDKTPFHLGQPDADCLRAYLTGFESIEKAVDAAAVACS